MAAAPKLDSLEERLMDHAKSFDSLLSLMPADVYFGKDNSDQWQKKKQTKEEKRAAKRAKLDPDNAKTAKDIFDQQAANARKRKREDDGGEEDATNVKTIVEENGIEKSISNGVDTVKKGKKPKREAGDVTQAIGNEMKESEGDGGRKAKADKAREKRERKRAKAAKKAAKAETKKARKQQETALVEDSESAARQSASKAPIADDEEADGFADGSEGDANEIEPIEMDNGFAEEDLAATASPSPTAEISMFDASNQDSGSSSISSIVPPLPEKSSLLSKIDTSSTAPPSQHTNTTDNPDATYVQPESTPEELKARLAARIEALRTARKASDPSQTPQTRQDLIESRRRKEEERKAHKKELRRKAREEEAAHRSESLTRGSPLLSNTNSPLLSPGSPAASSENNNFSFNRISFANGQHANSSLDAILTPSSKQKGPSDPLTTLQAAEKRQSRLAALDPEKQADIADKDVWLNAGKRARGDRNIRKDDTSLLKKALKRKEKQKKRSEKEWGERIEGVKRGQAVKQKKREGNLLKRREEKGKSKGGGGGSKKKKKARPGFEGSFKAKASSSGGGGGGEGGVEKPRRR